MKEFSEICFQVRTDEGLADFYGHILGMSECAEGARTVFAYGAGKCRLAFDIGDFSNSPPGGEDQYWKIGLTVQNLDVAVAYLQQQGWPVSAPRQFQQIGYLCHLQDPQGNNIELLQQGFEGRAGPQPTGHPIASQATLAHITLRVTDIAACRAYLEGELGLRLMSIQPVNAYGFTLYFFSWNSETLPNADLAAIENREWLWARPYPLLELQHVHDGITLRRPIPAETGFTALHFGEDGNADEKIDLNRLG